MAAEAMSHTTNDARQGRSRKHHIAYPVGWRTLVNAVVCLTLLLAPRLRAQQFDGALLEHVRAAARMVPGKAPQSLRYVKYAQSSLPMSALVEGGDTSLWVG